LDIVPRNNFTIPLIMARQPTGYNYLAEEVFVYINNACKFVAKQLLTDYAWALVEGFCPAHMMDIEYLIYNPKWKPANSDHHFTTAAPRSL